jgi:DNA invertase Pin-like site-specific DNA recombinase
MHRVDCRRNADNVQVNEVFMRVALYARVSKDEKEKDSRYQDPENQLVALRQYCTARGWEVVAEYIDRLSGADPNRPEFKKAMKEYWLKDYKAIVVWKFDRFSRQPLFVSMSYIEQLKTHKIGLISMTESWLDTRQENPMGDLVIAIMAWASAEERRKISERTKAGIAKRRAIGQWRGGRPKKRGGALTTEEKPTA